MRKLLISLTLVTLFISGCAIENLNPDGVNPSSAPTMPSPLAKPTKQQRGAIMSGENPDWRETPGPVVPRSQKNRHGF